MSHYRNTTRPPMRTRTARRLLSWFGVSTGALALLTACSDAGMSTAPAAPGPRQNVTVSATASDTTYTTFTYNPLVGLEQGFAGAHKLSMPSGAVCDPLTSGYGAGTWDRSCVPAAAPIVFTSKAWYDAAGRPHITFSPDVRFVPGKVVTLRLKDPQASTLGLGTIVWCPSGGTGCVNEAVGDASMTTYFSKNELFVFRRLKHFSGYHIVFRSCEQDPYAEGCDGGAVGSP